MRAAAAVLALAIAPVASPLAGDDSWRVSDIHGEARVRAGEGSWQALERGQEIPPDSQVETGHAGRLLLVRPGDSIAVSPNSLFTVPKDAERVSTRANPTTHIVQESGTLLFKIKTRPERPFGVDTPFLAAIIKGTTFTVSVKPETAALHVSEGAVQVDSILSGESILVRPGQTAAVGPANGGRLRMFGMRPSDRGLATAAKAVKPEIGDPEGSAERSVSPAAKSRKPGLRIGKTIGVRRVNIGRASQGLLSAEPSRKARSVGAGGKPVAKGRDGSNNGTAGAARPGGKPAAIASASPVSGGLPVSGAAAPPAAKPEGRAPVLPQTASPVATALGVPAVTPPQAVPVATPAAVAAPLPAPLQTIPAANLPPVTVPTPVVPGPPALIANIVPPAAPPVNLGKGPPSLGAAKPPILPSKGPGRLK